MASGTLSLTTVSPTGTLTLTFVGATTFDHGTLTVEDTRTGATTTQAVVNGTNSLTGLEGGVRYAFYVESYDDTDAFLGVSNHVMILMPSMTGAGAWPTVETSWRTDRMSEWHTVISSIGDDNRISIPINGRGYWYQQRCRCTEQNARLLVHGIKVNIRVKGKGERARSA